VEKKKLSCGASNEVLRLRVSGSGAMGPASPGVFKLDFHIIIKIKTTSFKVTLSC
jgi:hypothetical protein